MLGVQDFDGGAFENRDSWTSEVSGKDRGSQADPDQKTFSVSARRLAASITALLVVHVLCGAILLVTPAARLGVIPLP